MDSKYDIYICIPVYTVLTFTLLYCTEHLLTGWHRISTHFELVQKEKYQPVETIELASLPPTLGIQIKGRNEPARTVQVRRTSLTLTYKSNLLMKPGEISCIYLLQPIAVYKRA